MANFPERRLRRLRTSQKIRDLIQEVSLSPKDLICPVFVEEGIEAKKQVNSMPAIERLPLSEVVNEVNTISELGIPAVMLFGIPGEKIFFGNFTYLVPNGVPVFRFLVTGIKPLFVITKSPLFKSPISIKPLS